MKKSDPLSWRGLLECGSAIQGLDPAPGLLLNRRRTGVTPTAVPCGIPGALYFCALIFNEQIALSVDAADVRQVIRVAAVKLETYVGLLAAISGIEVAALEVARFEKLPTVVQGQEVALLIDAAYPKALSFTWVGRPTIVPLGVPGTPKGCADGRAVRACNEITD